MEFTEKENDMIKFALQHLHDSDLSNLKKEDIEDLESVMNKFGMNFISYID